MQLVKRFAKRIFPNEFGKQSALYITGEHTKWGRSLQRGMLDRFEGVSGRADSARPTLLTAFNAISRCGRAGRRGSPAAGRRGRAVRLRCRPRRFGSCGFLHRTGSDGSRPIRRQTAPTGQSAPSDRHRMRPGRRECCPDACSTGTRGSDFDVRSRKHSGRYFPGNGHRETIYSGRTQDAFDAIFRATETPSVVACATDPGMPGSIQALHISRFSHKRFSTAGSHPSPP